MLAEVSAYASDDSRRDGGGVLAVVRCTAVPGEAKHTSDFCMLFSIPL